MTIEPLTESHVVDLLRLHADEQGNVWYGYDGSVGENSRCSVPVFFDKLKWLGVTLGSVRVIRLLGVEANAELIVFLHNMRVKNRTLSRGQRVVLGSPMVCPTAEDRGNPARVLANLWQPQASLPSGCWHDLGDKDFTAYAIIASLRESKGEVDERARRIFRYHPMWPAVSFIPSSDHDAACLLAARIVDPRWFRHPTRPHRLSRLHAHLGFTPKNLQAWLSNSGDCERNYEWFTVLMRAWLGCTGVTDKSRPNHFLWRSHATAGGAYRGTLAATRRFVRFVYEVWSSEVATPRPEGGFLPSSFFKSPMEIAAYVNHRQTLNNAV